MTDLGTLGDDPLETVGRWTTEDCESRFRAGSDAHTYRFTVAAPGRVRIDLTSAGADAYLYLLADDGSRIADDDDGGARIDARVERDLSPGTYLIEATTPPAGGAGDLRTSPSPSATLTVASRSISARCNRVST